MQQTTDSVIIASDTGGTCAQVGGHLHEQVHVAREHWVDFEEILLGDRLTGVAVELEVTTVPLEQCAQRSLLRWRLAEQPFVDHIADVRCSEVHTEMEREAVLELANATLVVTVFELLLSSGEQPHLALELLSQVGDKRLQGQHAVGVLMDVLTHLVNDQEERLAGGAVAQHITDGLGRFGDGRANTRLCASTAVDPAHRIHVAVRLHLMHHLRKILFGELVVLASPHGRPSVSSAQAQNTSHLPSSSSLSSCSAT